MWDLADRFAQRVKREAGKDSAKQIQHAYLLALSRVPSAEEREIGLELLAQESERRLVEYCHLIFGLNEFIYVH